MLTRLADMARDVRHGVRTLARAPVFTLVAVVTMAVAIGANTAIFSLVDVLVFRDLPVREPGRLVEFLWQYPRDPPMNAFSVPNYDTYRTQNTVFSDLIGIGPVGPPSGAVGETLSGDYVTGNFFPALGVRAAWGRLIGLQDDQAGATAVAVLSWGCWRNRFNLDPGILGRTISVGGIPATVVGVADRRFSGLVVGYKPDAWIPAATCPARGFMLMGRLKDGVSLAQAQAEMRVLDRARIEALAVRDPRWRTVTLDVRSARAGLTTPLHQQFAMPLVVLLGIVGALMVLACVNIASLLFARAAARRREMAIRRALGASGFRIVRQVLIESLLLATAGSVLGIVGASFSVAFLTRLMSSGTRMIGPPPHLETTIDGRVLLFAIAVTVLAAMIFGVAPASAAFASTPTETLKESAGTGQTRSRRMFGSGLVVAQVALSLVLLSVSDLFVDHLAALRDRDLGFNRASVLLVSLDVAHTAMKRDELNAVYPDLLARLEAIPGVVSAAVSGVTPLSGAGWSQFVTVEGFREAPEARRRMWINNIAPNYFATFATPVIAGRAFRVADANGPRVAIVNQALAKIYFAGGSPIGKRILLEGQLQPFEVVGFVGDAKYDDVRQPAPPTMYLDYAQWSAPPSEFSLRTSLPPMRLAGDVRRAMGDALGGTPVKSMTTLAERVDGALVPERLVATLSGVFGAVGVLLAALGLYGLLAYTVARRTGEIGLRMALGAARRDVLRLVLRQAFGLVCAGFILGAPIAVWVERVAASLVESLAPGGAVPVLVGAVVTMGVALLAAYVPARRATRIDPLTALRSE